MRVSISTGGDIYYELYDRATGMLIHRSYYGLEKTKYDWDTEIKAKFEKFKAEHKEEYEKYVKDLETLPEYVGDTKEGKQNEGFNPRKD